MYPMEKLEIDARVRKVQLDKADERLVWILGQIKKKMIEIGKHLEEVRDQKLYEKRYATFEKFCRAEFGFGNKRANQIIAAENVRALLAASPEVVSSPELATNVARMSEAHLRTLAKVEPKKRARIVRTAAKLPGPITAAKLQQAAGICPLPQPQHTCPACGHRF